MIVLIDGRSGAGKTEFARHLGDILGATVVHLDDFYPGWGGLAAASEIVAQDVLREAGGGFHRWDWTTNTTAEWVPHGWSPQDACLIVEGCGSITNRTIEQAQKLDSVFTMFFDGDETVRRQRVLRRDGEVDSWWDMWAQQEQLHMAQLPPVDVVKDGTENE